MTFPVDPIAAGKLQENLSRAVAQFKASVARPVAESGTKPHAEHAAEYAAGGFQETIGKTDADTYADELAHLWNDLDQARRNAATPGTWTLACGNLTWRIVKMTVATQSPTPWQEVQIGLLEDGVYQAIMDATGLPYEAPDMVRVAEVRAGIEGRRV